MPVLQAKKRVSLFVQTSLFLDTILVPSVMPRDLIVCSTRSFVLRCARGCVCASIPSHVLHLARHAHQSLHSASEKSVDRSSPTTCLLSCPTTSIELLHPRRPVREVKSKVKSRDSAVASSIFDSFFDEIVARFAHEDGASRASARVQGQARARRRRARIIGGVRRFATRRGCVQDGGTDPKTCRCVGTDVQGTRAG